MSIVYSWPVGLPTDPIKQGYNDTHAPNQIRSPTDFGPSKKRRRSTWTPRELTITLPMTRAQVVLFEDFWLSTLAHGSHNFTFPHPRTGATLTWEMLNEPNPRPDIGQDWLVTLELREIKS